MTTMTTNKIYYSREDRIADIYSDDERVQYQDAQEDLDKLDEPFDALDFEIDNLYQQIPYFFHVVNMGEGPETIKLRREAMVAAWAQAQAALSRIGWILRIDGNEAFQRVVDARHNDTVPNLSGL